MKVRLPVRKAILRRKTYEAPAEGRLNKLRLDFNENTTGCGPAVLRALRKLTPKQLAMYPEYAEPTRRIASYFGVAAEELLLTNGGDDALRVFFDAFVEPTSHILICEPTFPMYRYYAEIAGARVETLRYDGNMEFPLDEFVAALRKKPGVLFIANPNNPTGTLLQPDAIKRILRCGDQYRCGDRRSVCGVFRSDGASVDSQVSAALCGAHVFESGRSRGTEVRGGDGVPGFACDSCGGRCRLFR